MRIIAYVSGALVIVAIAVFALALWLIQVPPVSANSDSVEQDLNAWFDERHQQSFQHFNGAALVIRDGDVIVLLENGSSAFVSDLASEVWKAID